MAFDFAGAVSSVFRSPPNTLTVFASDGDVAVAGADEAVAGAECAQIGEAAANLAAHGEAGEAKVDERAGRRVELEGLRGLDELRRRRKLEDKGEQEGRNEETSRGYLIALDWAGGVAEWTGPRTRL